MIPSWTCLYIEVCCKLCFCLLFLKSIMMTLWVRSFGVIWIRISHTFKQNQAPNVASSVGYIISRMSRPFCKVFCSCISTQNVKNIYMKFFPRVHITCLGQTSKLNSTWVCKQNHVNKIMTESISYMCSLCCQNETSITNFTQ